jgi:excisionase family DNA binding protein
MSYDDLPELLTIGNAAELLNVHPNTLRNWEKEGLIEVVRIGRRGDRRFSKELIWGLMRRGNTA